MLSCPCPLCPKEILFRGFTESTVCCSRSCNVTACQIWSHCSLWNKWTSSKFGKAKLCSHFSYSTTRNIKSHISASNFKKLKPSQPQNLENCKCEKQCPVNGDCTVQNVVYQAVVKTRYTSKKIHRNVR